MPSEISSKVTLEIRALSLPNARISAQFLAFSQQFANFPSVTLRTIFLKLPVINSLRGHLAG
jgi:hypothetical protein